MSSTPSQQSLSAEINELSLSSNSADKKVSIISATEAPPGSDPDPFPPPLRLVSKNKVKSSTSNTSNQDAASQLVAAVDDMLSQLEGKFSTVSGDMIAKMDEMSKRLDNLESTILAGNETSSGESGKEK